MKKGFTLIELLAVIVILAIISLIASPIIINVIETAKIGATERTIENIERAAELFVYNREMNEEFEKTTFVCENGKCSNGKETLEINGKTPKSGNIIIDKNGKVLLKNIVLDGYLCNKIKENYKCEKTNYYKNSTTNGIMTINTEKKRDLENYKIYGNSVQGILPSEYQQVEYIESTGTQYIDTGFIPNQDTGFDITFLTKNEFSSSKYGSIMGAREGSCLNEFQLTTFTNNTYKGVFRYGNGTYDAGLVLNQKINIKIFNKIYTDSYGETQTLDKTFSAPVSLTVFALNNNGTIAQKGEVQLYNLKLFDGNVLIRNFVPCYRISDNVIGLYDTVNNVFYENSGTGVFLKGNKTNGYETIPSLDKPVEIQSVGDLITDITDPNYGKYKIPIKVSGKNLFNINNFNVLHNNNRLKYSVINQKLSMSVKNINSSSFIVIDIGKLSDFNGKTIVFSSKKRDDNIFKSSTIIKCNPDGSNRSNLGLVYGTNNYSIATISGDYTDERLAIRIYLSDISADTEYMMENIMVEISEVATDYEPYVESIITNIYLDEPLRRAGNYSDYIDFKTGKVVRKVGYKQFDGSEAWELHTITNDGYGVFKISGVLTPLIGAPSSSTFMSHFALTDVYSTSSFGLGWYRFTYNKTTHEIADDRLYVSSSKTTLEEFKDWLSTNKPSIYYPLAKEFSKEEKVDLPYIQTLKGTTILSVDTAIVPNEFVISYYD